MIGWIREQISGGAGGAGGAVTNSTISAMTAGAEQDARAGAAPEREKR